jgi:very-short-patch-repair endonuclease
MSATTSHSTRLWTVGDVARANPALSSGMKRPFVPVQLTAEPFTTGMAASYGVSSGALQSGLWRRVFRDVWAHEDLPETREFRLAAARLVLTEPAVLCGLTAAWVHGADVRREDDLDVHVGFPRGKRIRKRPGLQVCQETLEPTDWTEIDGVRVTTPLRTAFDCLRWLRGAERLVVADALTHCGTVDLLELRRYFAGKKRLRNLRIGEALLPDVEPKSESPMETRMRVQLLLSGLPRPEAQHEVLTATGALVGRVDLAYPEVKLAIEYDGAWHWKQRRADDRRRAWLRTQGWEVLVYDADDVYGRPLEMCAEVKQALRSRTRQAG